MWRIPEKTCVYRDETWIKHERNLRSRGLFEFRDEIEGALQKPLKLVFIWRRGYGNFVGV